MHKVPTVSFRDTDEIYTSIRDGHETASAQYNGTNYITHNIKLSYCRKLFISYRLNEFSARSVVTVKNDVSDSNNACETILKSHAYACALEVLKDNTGEFLQQTYNWSVCNRLEILST